MDASEETPGGPARVRVLGTEPGPEPAPSRVWVDGRCHSRRNSCWSSVSANASDISVTGEERTVKAAIYHSSYRRPDDGAAGPPAGLLRKVALVTALGQMVEVTSSVPRRFPYARP